jgi:putative ATPase
VDLFEQNRRNLQAHEAPLAARMRPSSFDDLIGQEHIVGSRSVLRRVIEANQPPSIILWGPPGSGKTTLAHLIAGATKSHFEPISAATAGVADLRRIVEEARERRRLHGWRTILFIDEIHHFNKTQQVVILPHIEDGTFTFIGATTENPSFEVIAPLLSRCSVMSLHPLSDKQMEEIVERAIANTEHGFGQIAIALAPDAMQLLVKVSNGDARVSLNGLETACYSIQPDQDGTLNIDLSTMQDALQRRPVLYDKAGDKHYDHISAFIKSVRGSSPDASLYWMARMLEAGEDPLFIARRLIILAAEDVGLADPGALSIAVAAQQAVHFIGMPEAAIPLAEATVYLATAPKSNSTYAALGRAMKDVKMNHNEQVPLHLRNPVNDLMKDMNYGEGYKYSHDYPGHFAIQEFLPEGLSGRVYYHPSEEGEEKKIAERLRNWWNRH